MTNFVTAMMVQGLAASEAVRGRRLLKIGQMSTPVLLSRPCQICMVRKVVPPRPSTWHYRPLIDATALIMACDVHTSGAVRGYLRDNTPGQHDRPIRR